MFNLDFGDTDELDFDLDLDFDSEAFIDDSVAIDPEQITPFARVKRHKRTRTVAYEYAQQLSDDIGILDEGDCIFALCSGNFISGDFIEAYLTKHNLFAESLIVATLSLSKNNIDSFKNLQIGGYVGNLAIIVSDYFFCHERKNVTEYIIEELANDHFYFAAAAIHTKIALIKTECGKHIVIHGSANLRSSRNIEQMIVENNKTVYDFNEVWMKDILKNYAVDHKRLRGEKLWHQVARRQDSQDGEIR
jgi:hypothetical protein